MTVPERLSAESVVNLEHVKVLRLEAGDVIVLRTKLPVSAGAASLLQEQLERAFPGHKALLLDNDAELAVLRNDGSGA